MVGGKEEGGGGKKEEGGKEGGPYLLRENLHMKGVGMLAVSLRDVNFRFGLTSGKNDNIYNTHEAVKVSFRVSL